ncbi:molybdenum cofactor biosynthesis protein B [Sulfobacillus sp. hq2]|uniref:MogA/MoaB family molybdenum cofactor biosynthesis protein n=1 Tax=Sulfobacillus TaxID=28033 RepID=UPI000CD25706|nr:MogA/MoaB family molybdenum cofactor biosynthesis protein [Sulfobacillus sp. hq2]POB11893.1 molybdenum cofactor biosynthesis protein [Sulfobacillus sp. hq2]
MWTIAILTSSDQGATGKRADESGAILATHLEQVGKVVERKILPDEEELLAQQMQKWIDQGIDLILTTGGTGLGPRDVTPEATRRVIDRDISGIAEALRQESMRHTPMGMLSRGIAGQAKMTLIINLPGSPRAIEELLPVIFPVLDHAMHLIHGQTTHEK